MTASESPHRLRNEKVSYFAKKRCRVSLLLLTFFLTAPTHAEGGLLESCARLFRGLGPSPASRLPAKKARPQKILVHGARGPGEPKLRGYIDEANDVLAELSLPPHLDIDVTGGAQDIHYLYEDFRIVLPKEFAGDFTRETETAKRSFLQHEYGHAVFDENFGKFSTEWKNWLITAQARGLFDSQSRAPFPQALHRLSAPYQELFADLLTVATHGDPQAISRPLHRFVDAGDPRVTMRDFGGTVFEARWTEPEEVVGEFGPIRGANPLEAPPEKLRKISDEHLAFSPVRAYLWENYFSRPDLADQKPALMRLVFVTIAQELLERHADDNLRKLSFPQASARLLKALDKSLAGYQLK
jgi:hypothetical protein